MYKEINYSIYNNKLKKNINILHVSDIHFYKNNDIKLLDNLYNKFKKHKLNYIIITGDTLDENKKNKPLYLKEWIYKLSKIAVVIIGFGNHDMYFKIKGKYVKDFNKPFWDDINKINNVYVLNNSNYEDNNIYVYGHTSSIYYYYHTEKKNILLEELDKIEYTPINKYNICLIHSPLFLNSQDVSKKLEGFDMILSGHMHNGLMPPVFDELFNNTVGIVTRDKKFFSKMCRGYYLKKYICIISSGINKLHSRRIYLLNLFNMLYPKSYNIIRLRNKKCKFTISCNYSK